MKQASVHSTMLGVSIHLAAGPLSKMSRNYLDCSDHERTTSERCGGEAGDGAKACVGVFSAARAWFVSAISKFRSVACSAV
jgi:hypothetical protein